MPIDDEGAIGSGEGPGGLAPPASQLGGKQNSLGSPSTGEHYGDEVVVKFIPGDLGTLYLVKNKMLLFGESIRQNANYNGLTSINLRYRGHREAGKFNLMMQKLLTISADLFLTLRTANDLLETRELNDMYPTDTEISEIQHTREQINFKEWMLLKDSDQKWFT